MFRPISFPFPALLCITEGAHPSKLHSLGSCVNTLLEGWRKTEGVERWKKPGPCPLPLCFRDILRSSRISPMAPTPAEQTHLVSYFLKVSLGLGLLQHHLLCNISSSFLFSILVCPSYYCSVAYLTLPCSALSSSSPQYNQFSKLIFILNILVVLSVFLVGFLLMHVFKIFNMVPGQ